MTNLESRLQNRTARAAVWTQGYDGETHYAAVAKALAPALFILAAATALMLALL